MQDKQEDRVIGKKDEQIAPPIQTTKQYIKVGEQLLDVDNMELGGSSRPHQSQAKSYAGQVLLEAVRREYQYARFGLALGLATILSGTILCLHGAAGTASWTAKALGVLESQLNDAAPGSVIFVIGVFVIIFTRPRVKLARVR